MAATTGDYLAIAPYLYDGVVIPRYIYFDWYITEIDYALRRTKIHYKVFLENYSSGRPKAKCTAKINGQTLCSVGWASYYYAGYVFGEGDYWIQHDSNGEASFSVYLYGAIYYEPGATSKSATYQLPHVDQGIVYIDSGSAMERYQAYVDNGTSWDLCIPYTDNGSGWDIMA